jgi:hypothetical protein
MAIVTASNHFVPTSNVPVRSISMSAGLAYAAFVRSQSGGLVAEDHGTPLYYLTVNFLWHSLSINAQSVGGAAASIMLLSGYLLRFLNPNDPLGQNVRKASPGINVIPIAKLYLGTHEPEPQTRNADSVIQVRTPAGHTAGWYFGNEDVAGTVRTPRPTFKCKSCGASNDEPDSNVCTSCGKDIY